MLEIYVGEKRSAPLAYTIQPHILFFYRVRRSYHNDEYHLMNMKSAIQQCPQHMTFVNIQINKPKEGVCEESEQSGAMQELPPALGSPAQKFYIENIFRVGFITPSIAQGCGINWRKPICQKPYKFNSTGFLVESLKVKF